MLEEQALVEAGEVGHTDTPDAVALNAEDPAGKPEAPNALEVHGVWGDCCCALVGLLPPVVADAGHVGEAGVDRGVVRRRVRRRTVLAGD